MPHYEIRESTPLANVHLFISFSGKNRHQPKHPCAVKASQWFREVFACGQCGCLSEKGFIFRKYNTEDNKLPLPLSRLWRCHHGLEWQSSGYPAVNPPSQHTWQPWHWSFISLYHISVWSWMLPDIERLNIFFERGLLNLLTSQFIRGNLISLFISTTENQRTGLALPSDTHWRLAVLLPGNACGCLRGDKGYCLLCWCPACSPSRAGRLPHVETAAGTEAERMRWGQGHQDHANTHPV